MNDRVKIAALELFAVDLPFRRRFRHAAAERSSSESVFLKCVTDSGASGFGEALPRPYVTGETRDGAFALLRDAILPTLLGRSFGSLDEVESFLTDCDGRAPADCVSRDTPQGAAWSAVDLALLDAFGRGFGTRPLRRHQGGLPESFRYSGVVGDDRGAQRLLSVLKQRLYGLRSIKMKVGRENAETAARWTRRLAGRRIDLRVDANMAWNTDTALANMRALSRSGIAMFEQPVEAGDLSGMARLTADSGLGVMADESFNTRESLAELIGKRACTAVNARISKCGGLMATLARCREALAAGLDLQVGCQVGESSLLSAAHLLVCSAVAPVRYAEGCFGRRLLREDPGSPVLEFGFGGRPPAQPAGPGFGVTIDERILRRFAIQQATVTTHPSRASGLARTASQAPALARTA